MGIVYCIECLETGEKYIGSTKTPLNVRMYYHKSQDCSSKQIIDRGNYTSYIVEEVEEDDILREREQYHMDNTECINKRRANGHNAKEYKKKYREKNREENIEYGKKYYQDNREWFRERRKEKITCECGAIICRGAKSLHLKCKRHQNWVISQNSSVT